MNRVWVFFLLIYCVRGISHTQLNFSSGPENPTSSPQSVTIEQKESGPALVERLTKTYESGKKEDLDKLTPEDLDRAIELLTPEKSGNPYDIVPKSSLLSTLKDMKKERAKSQGTSSQNNSAPVANFPSNAPAGQANGDFEYMGSTKDHLTGNTQDLKYYRSKTNPTEGYVVSPDGTAQKTFLANGAGMTAEQYVRADKTLLSSSPSKSAVPFSNTGSGTIQTSSYTSPKVNLGGKTYSLGTADYGKGNSSNTTFTGGYRPATCRSGNCAGTAPTYSMPSWNPPATCIDGKCDQQ